MPHLRVLLGYQQGHVFPLATAPIIIGREPSSDIVLGPDSAASRRHAEVVFAEGDWLLRDLGSVNGTLVNGAKLAETPLSHGDEVIIGDNVFIFEHACREISETEAQACRAFPRDPEGIQNCEDTRRLIAGVAEKAAAIEANFGGVLPGAILAGILARGHILMDTGSGAAAPGAIAGALGLSFTQHHCDSATMVDVLLKSQAVFASDIGSAAAPVRATLWQVMQDFVRADGSSLPSPFVVFSGRAGLTPEQQDRFMICPFAPELAHTGDVERQFTASEILVLQHIVRDLPVGDRVLKYAVRLVRATRPADRWAPEAIKDAAKTGAGAHTARQLLLVAKARAILQGRTLVSTDDVAAMAPFIFRHRLGSGAAELTRQILASVPVPGES